MASVQASGKRKNSAAARLGVVTIIVLQAFGLAGCSLQEPASAQLDAEFAKQEQIYRSRGAAVPGGYITTRGLWDYAQALPSGFCNALAKLGSSDRWLDIGAGEGQAILDYYGSEDDPAPTEQCGWSGDRARAVALSIEDRRGEKWHQRAANLGVARLRYLYGKPLREYATADLGKFQIVTDVFGGFSYTDNLSKFVEKVLSMMEVGGTFYTLVQSVRLENGKEKPGTYYLTELNDPAGHDMKVCTWLKQTACAQVTCESKSDWQTPTELINVRKLCSDVAVPPLKLLKFEAGNPPGRKFQLETRP